MPKVFHPVHFIDVPASAPHAPNTKYRVSIGVEDWEEGETSVEVVKVQMVYDGQVSGRSSPSYPKGNGDLEKVLEALKKITGKPSKKFI